MSRLTLMAIVGFVVAIAVVLVYSFTMDRTLCGAGQVWDPQHGHCHNVS